MAETTQNTGSSRGCPTSQRSQRKIKEPHQPDGENQIQQANRDGRDYQTQKLKQRLARLVANQKKKSRNLISEGEKQFKAS